MRNAILFLTLALGVYMVTVNTQKLPFVSKRKDFDDLFTKYGNQYGFNPYLLKSIAMVESSLNPNAKARTSSATGLMQITKAAAKDMGENHANMFDPETNIRTGAKYLRWLIDTYGFTIEDAVKAYYAGGGTIRQGNKGYQFTKKWQVDAWAYSTKYLSKVVNNYNAYITVV
jgi:soluble lytic murein transglycosylase-like protein